MRMLRYSACSLTACALMLFAAMARGASPADTMQTAQVEVTTDPDSAVVYLDSILAGRTPLTLPAVLPGSHVLRVIPPRPEAWSVHPVTDTVHLSPGESRRLFYRLRSFIAIRSAPGGAGLYRNDSLAGITPFLVRPDELRPDDRLELRLTGYEPAVLLPSALAGETALTVALKAGWHNQAGEEPPAVLSTTHWTPRKVGLFVSGGVSILAGMGAAYFKIAADEKQEAYLATGDPAMASERRRLDTLAGVSLALAQAGIIVLSYLLISE